MAGNCKWSLHKQIQFQKYEEITPLYVNLHSFNYLKSNEHYNDYRKFYAIFLSNEVLVKPIKMYKKIFLVGIDTINLEKLNICNQYNFN